jgi:signal transduction histidine kinase
MKLLDDASAAIQYNRDLLQSALDNVRQGIAVFDRDLRLICWNRQFRHLLGLPQDLGRVGVPLGEVVRHIVERGDAGEGDVERTIAERINTLIVTMEPHQERMPDGGPVLEVRGNSMPDGGIVVTFADITERVDAAEALKRANETLERRVQERTAELTSLNKELERAKAGAEEANIGKTRFLAAASHDILQPLNAARLYATSLVERNTQSSDRQLVSNIDASLEAVEEIIGALLDISRLDAGALRPEISTFRIEELLTTLDVEFAPLAAEKNLTLRTMPCSLSVRSDRRLVRRVLQNLVSNALKYTTGGRVLVGCRRRGDSLAIEVHDTGPGIPVGKQKLIFQEFQRLENNGASAKGLGLGLSIVERIAQMLGHPIGLRSTPGHGSVFTLTVPLAVALPATLPAPRTARAALADLSGLSVLCIDNEPKILDGMKALLGGWGCEVLTAIGGAAALDIVRERGKPDIILADYHLDAENGLDLVTRLRWKLDAELPAILITADRSRTVQDQARTRDVIVLNKPIKPAALRSLLARSRAKLQAAE